MLGEENLEEGHQSVPEQFYKRRRDLILLSAFVIFVNTISLKIDKLNFFGNELVLARPEMMPWILGTVLAYFLVRYLQYAHMIDDKGFLERFNKSRRQFFRKWITYHKFREPEFPLRRRFKKYSEFEIGRFFMFENNMRGRQVFITWVSTHPEASFMETTFDGDVSEREMNIARVVAIFYIIFRTPLVTEYIFPAAFAMAAFLTYLPYFQGLLERVV